MKTRNLIGLLALSTTITLTLGLAPRQSRPAATSPAQPETLAVDPVHSSIIFKINHLGASNFYGRFNDVAGTVVFDAANPAHSSFDVQIKTQSIDTNNKNRDDHLRNAEFFDAEQFPTLAFKSSSVKAAGKGKLQVTGDLSLHGVTKPITVEIAHVGTVDHPRFGHRSGFETTFTIKRSDFGMGAMVDTGMLGDEVQLTVSIECVRGKS